MRTQIARASRLAAFAAGLLVACASCTMVVVLEGLDELRKLDEAQAAAATIQSVDLDTRVVPQRLNRNYPPVCTEANLRRLRQELFLSTHQADIGVLDQGHRLLCTTAMRRLPRPVDMPTPDVILRGEVGEESFINFSMPLLIWDGRYRATVVRSGNSGWTADRAFCTRRRWRSRPLCATSGRRQARLLERRAGSA